MKVCGVDEAGRGPIVGPLVICGLMVDEADIPKLKAIGVKDSKLLTPKKREQLAAQIEMIATYALQIVTPKEIDETLRSDTMNLNWLEAVRTAMIANQLKPGRLIIDCPSNNIKAYKDYLSVYLQDKNMEFIADHKAESKYEVVAAASIIAKVTRDREIEAIKAAIGIDFGSGYTSDPKTRAKLEEIKAKHPHVLRHEWSTIKKNKGVKKLTEY